jgi:hypothetical protein
MRTTMAWMGRNGRASGNWIRKSDNQGPVVDLRLEGSMALAYIHDK